MKKSLIVVFLILMFSTIIRFFCGIYIHDEFVEEHLFIKHRPTWKWKFYSPIGMSDTKFEELNIEKQIEQRYFDEFVSNQDLSK